MHIASCMCNYKAINQPIYGTLTGISLIAKALILKLALSNYVLQNAEDNIVIGSQG